MKLKTGLLLLLIVGGVAYGGAKFYLHSKTKEKLDNLVTMVSPFVEMSYGEIHSDLRGSLAVDQLYISSPDGAVLQIGRAQVEGSGPGFLLDLMQGFDQGEPPEKLVLKVSRLSVPVDQNLSASFGSMGTDGDLSQPHQPCTLGGLFKYAGLEKIGMEQMIADAVMGYNLDKAQGSARIFFDYDLQDIETMSFNLEMDGLPEPGAVIMGQLPILTDFELSYHMLPAYAQKMVGYCSRQSDLTQDQFLSEMFDKSERYFSRNLGFLPGAGLQDMLQSLLRSGGTVQVTAASLDNLDPSQLFAYQPDQLIDLFGIEVTFNDKPITDLSLEMPALGEGMSGFPGWSNFGFSNPESQSSQSEGLDEDASAPTQRPLMQYVEVAASELPRHVGSNVRLYTSGAPKPKQGFLISYKNGTFSVEQSVHRGKMTAHVARSDLVRAEVLKQIPPDS